MNDKDFRDIEETDPTKYFAYTSPSTQPKTTHYILVKDLERLMEGEIPQQRDFDTGSGASYFRNTDGKFAGTACAAHFLSAKEIQEFVAKDKKFVSKAIKSNATWFLPPIIKDIFLF